MPQISISWMFCEWLSTYLYQSNPLPGCEFRNTQTQKLDEQYKLQGVQFDDNQKEQFEVVNKAFPETEQHGLDRALENMEAQKKSTLG